MNYYVIADDTRVVGRYDVDELRYGIEQARNDFPGQNVKLVSESCHNNYETEEIEEGEFEFPATLIDRLHTLGYYIVPNDENEIWLDYLGRVSPDKLKFENWSELEIWLDEIES